MSAKKRAIERIKEDELSYVPRINGTKLLPIDEACERATNDYRKPICKCKPPHSTLTEHRRAFIS